MSGKRVLASIVTAFFLSIVMFFVGNDFGITWDEPEYFVQADRYVKWVKHPTFEKNASPFQVSKYDVHPPLRKLIGGLSHELLTNQLHRIDNTRGYRISTCMYVFPFIVIFTYIAIGQLGYIVGILCSLMFSFLPHVFFYSALFTPDYAIGVMWFIVVVSGMKAMKSVRWQLVCGICLGLTMLTKMHGFFLIVPLVSYWWLSRVNAKTKNSISSLLPLIIIFSVAVGIYLLGWPWLWTDTILHLKEYFFIQMTHVSAPVYVFGSTYEKVAWWYVPVMVFVTTPVFVLVLFVFGALAIIKKGTMWEKVMLGNALYPLMLFMLPFMPRYDGIRLFLPAFPFMILVSGVGIRDMIRRITLKKRIFALMCIIILWVISLYYSIIRIHPWESSYYNKIVGGIRGARLLGFETENWGNAYIGVLPWMNANKKSMMCVYPTTNSFYYYQAMGQIEDGVVFDAGMGACRYAIILMRQGMFDDFTNELIRTQKPVNELLLDGIPLVGIYDLNMN